MNFRPIDKKNVIFAVPGSKIYINKYYKNTPHSFLNISLTGGSCELQCSHCKAALLKDMVDINNPAFNHIRSGARWSNRLLNILSYFNDDRAKTNPKIKVRGILLSGGFSGDGLLKMDERIFKEIYSVKQEFEKEIKIFIHLGFADKNLADRLNQSGIDGALVNAFADSDVIHNVYNLQESNPDDFFETIKNLKDAGLMVSPHLIVGINRGKIFSEINAIEKIAETGADSIVLVFLKKATRQHIFPEYKIDNNEVLKLFNHIRKRIPGTPVTLGCARSAGKKTELLEISLLDSGIDAIAFPSEKAVEFAEKNGFKYKFIEECCALFK